MEQAVVIDTNNQPLTPGPLSFSRIPIAGDFIRISGTVWKVQGVLFDSIGPGTRAFVRAEPPQQSEAHFSSIPAAT
jgi:hypothetical protein